MNTRRSLGILEYPESEITEFCGGRATLTITLTTHNKRIAIVMGVGCLKQLVALAHQGTNKQRAYALHEWNIYKRLKTETGSTPPNGETDG